MGADPSLILFFGDIMGYYNDERIGRRGRAAKRLMDNFEASTNRSERAIRYNRQAYDGCGQEES
jgi:hypothetical protein